MTKWFQLLQFKRTKFLLWVEVLLSGPISSPPFSLTPPPSLLLIVFETHWTGSEVHSELSWKRSSRRSRLTAAQSVSSVERQASYWLEGCSLLLSCSSFLSSSITPLVSPPPPEHPLLLDLSSSSAPPLLILKLCCYFAPPLLIWNLCCYSAPPLLIWSLCCSFVLPLLILNLRCSSAPPLLILNYLCSFAPPPAPLLTSSSAAWGAERQCVLVLMQKVEELLAVCRSRSLVDCWCFD